MLLGHFNLISYSLISVDRGAGRRYIKKSSYFFLRQDPFHESKDFRKATAQESDIIVLNISIVSE